MNIDQSIESMEKTKASLDTARDDLETTFRDLNDYLKAENWFLTKKYYTINHTIITK